ncbi:DegT/DnrJ/EryC1/StrS family aminotransferase [Streptomyces tubbatahanensis]|uniref:DegT/DnrJ/EryC1/StrS family aminotransferase n=1 Tax=Streptomyces tubbatahanensis TaxID=2923272 RepID=A0ABY3XMY6_9ACTN|nr:DegT/DnrJ/EryC1/StrS family aminotransferase [Streptomyces tubbatahanensis]UNS95740.1 DegT/DnrJ/EryC1/StrS family aminotransferase [Streptomyces tubbatahanensis]
MTRGTEESISALSKPVPEPRKVPFFTQTAAFEESWPVLRRRLGEVLDSGVYSGGPACAELEARMADFTGARHALAVSNGTDALVLLLRAAGIGPGDDVVVPAFTFASSATSVALAGGRPVFADIDPATYGIDARSLEAVLTPRTKAVMPVHLFSQPAAMGSVLDVAARHRLQVLEDSAEGVGMRWNGVHTGLIGEGGVLSFFPTKTLGALGDAGMVLTDDDELAERAAALRNHGRPRRAPGGARSLTECAQQGELVGFNAKMDDIQAAVLLTRLARLDADIRRRAELAARYTEQLADVAGLLRLPAVDSRGASVDPVWYVYVIEAPDRDGLIRHLSAHGIETETYYPRPLHNQPCFAGHGHRVGDFPHAEAAARHTVALPLYPELTQADVDHVCAVIRSFTTGGVHS